jgi:hypothetical protein
MQRLGRFGPQSVRRVAYRVAKMNDAKTSRRDDFMKLIIEITSAALLVCCITATSAAFAAGHKTGAQPGGLSCAFSVPKAASPAARCGAIRRQCGGKFYANACGDKLLSAM